MRENRVRLDSVFAQQLERRRELEVEPKAPKHGSFPALDHAWQNANRCRGWARAKHQQLAGRRNMVKRRFDNGRHACRIDDAIETFRAERPQAPSPISICHNGMVGSHLSRDLQPALMQIYDRDASSDAASDELQEEQADSADSEDERAISDLRVEAVQAVQRAGQRLSEGCHDVGKIAAEIQVLRRRGDVLGESACAMKSNDMWILTQVRAAGMTRGTSVAGHGGMYHAVIAYLNALNTSANFDHSSRQFVAGDHRVRELICLLDLRQV